MELPAGFWDQPKIRTALARWDFATIVRTARYACGLTQEQMAERLGMAGTHVSRIECGRRNVTTLDVARRVANTLGIPPNLLGFTTPATVDQGPPVPEGDDPMKRRAFVHATSGLALGLGAAGLDLEHILAMFPPIGSGVTHLGVHDVEAIEHLTVAFHQLDNAYGGGLSRAAAVGQVKATLPLIEKATTSPELRSRLLIATANLAREAAWMSYDMQDHQAARNLWRIALTLARESDDPRRADLTVHTLTDAAAQMLSVGAPADAHTLVKTARAVAEDGVAGHTQSFLAHTQARIHAAMGDINGCERAIGQAEDTFEVADPDPDPARGIPWATGVHASALQAWQGWSRYELAMTTRDPKIAAKAVPALDHAIRNFPSEFTRSRALYLSDLCGAHAIADDLDAAAAAGHQSLDVGQPLRSQRLKASWRTLSTVLAPTPSHPAITELRERLTTA